MKWKTNFFKNLHSAAFATALIEFTISVLLFFLLCIVYTIANFAPKSALDNDIFIAKFEQYFVLAAGISFLVPTLFSFVLIIGLIKKNTTVIFTWIISALVFSPTIIFGILGGGVYLVTENALIVGVSAITMSALLIVPAIQSILVAFLYLRFLQKKRKSPHVTT